MMTRLPFFKLLFVVSLTVYNSAKLNTVGHQLNVPGMFSPLISYVVDVTFSCTKNVILLHACVHRPVAIRLSSSSSSSSIIGRMQAEATDSSLRGGIEALGVKDTEKSAAVQEEDNSEQQDAEMTDAMEEDSAAKDEKSKSIKQK